MLYASQIFYEFFKFSTYLTGTIIWTPRPYLKMFNCLKMFKISKFFNSACNLLLRLY